MFPMMISTLDDSRASYPLIPRGCKTFVVLVCFLVCFASGQQQDKSGFQRSEANGLVPNATLRKLLAVSAEEMSVYADAEAWGGIAGTVYDRPTAAAIVARVKARHPDRSHPRILATQADFSRIKEKIASDPLYARWFADVRRDADHILSQSPVREPSRHVLQRCVLPLALVYRVTGETRYAQRAWRELEAYAHFEHWNPTTQFLDIAYIAKGFAIGYDWLYGYLSRAQKDILIEAVSEKALKLVMVAYEHPTERTPHQNNKITGFDNWNGSINAGVMMASLAMCDEAQMETLAGQVMSHALRYWENYLKEFAPDGACREGVGYWYWGVQSLVEGMASLESATGFDYGIGETPGLASTAYFPFYMTGPKGAFNFGNAKSGFNITSEFYWFAKKYNDSKLATVRKRFMDRRETRADVYDLLWYDPALITSQDSLDELPLDMWFANTETVSMRSAWDDHALFVAFKGGDNMATHGHLNTGSFVLDALGQRWAVQLGGDRYSNPGYFSTGQRDSQGYQYYRVRAEGQNTLLINPTVLSDQQPHAISKVVSFSSDKDRAFAIIDMTSAYRHEANRVQRGIMLFDNRFRIVLRDEIQCEDASQIWWFMHTPANIAIDPRGRTVFLEQNGRRLLVQLICSDKAASFTVRDAVALPTSPQSILNRSNKGIKKLTLELNGIREVDISVVFTPVHSTPASATSVDVESLKNW